MIKSVKWYLVLLLISCLYSRCDQTPGGEEIDIFTRTINSVANEFNLIKENRYKENFCLRPIWIGFPGDSDGEFSDIDYSVTFEDEDQETTESENTENEMQSEGNSESNDNSNSDETMEDSVEDEETAETDQNTVDDSNSVDEQSEEPNSDNGENGAPEERTQKEAPATDDDQELDNDENRMFEFDFMHLTAKIIDIPGSGYITDFECPLNDDSVPAGFAVVSLTSNENDKDILTATIKCMVRSFGRGSYPDTRDSVPLQTPCKVDVGDQLAYFGLAGEQRCKSIKLPGRAAKQFVDLSNLDNEKSFFNIEIGDSFNLTNEHKLAASEERDPDLLTPLFSARFECDCSDKMTIGNLLMDREINGISEDVIYTDMENIIPMDTQIFGISLFTEYPQDDTLFVRIVGQESGEILCGEDFEVKGSKIGIENLFFSNGDCVLPENGYLQFDSHSRTLQRGFNRLSYSKTEEALECSLSINGRPQAICNRKYSIAALRRCYSSFTDSSDEQSNMPMPTEIEQSASQSPVDFCTMDYIVSKFNWQSNYANTEEIIGPMLYVDESHPLKSGILKKWIFHTYDYIENDFIHAVVWRKSEDISNDYSIICSQIGQINQVNGQTEIYPSSECRVKDNDFIGFVYTNSNKVPISAVLTPEESGFISRIMLNSDSLMTVSKPRKNGHYSFRATNQNIQFNIHAEQCLVGIKPHPVYNSMSSESITIQNDLYTRSMQSSESFIVADEMLKIPADGYVTKVHAWISQCTNDDLFFLIMSKPQFSDDGQKYQIKCRIKAPPCTQSNYKMTIDMYNIAEDCKVNHGDILGLSSRGSGMQQVSYDIVEGYQSFLLDPFLTKLGDSFHRKYSIGFTFQNHPANYLFGNKIVDRAWQLINKSADENSKLMNWFSYVDWTNLLPEGKLRSYEIFLNEPVSKLQFFTLRTPSADSESTEITEKCVHTVDGSMTKIGMNDFDVREMDCTIEEGDMLAVVVYDGAQSIHFDCNDPNFASEIEAGEADDILSPEAIECGSKIKLSVGAVVKVKNTDFIQSEPQTFQEIFNGWTSDMQSPNMLFDESCNINLENFGKISQNIEKLTNHSIAYVEESTVLESGMLEYWQIFVSEPASLLRPAVWRKFSGDKYELICLGHTEDFSIIPYSIEKVYPDSPCKVKSGDRIGFIAYASADLNIRVPASRDDMMFGQYQQYRDLDFTDFAQGGLYTMNEHMSGLHYPITASVCVSKQNDEMCKMGKVFSPSITLWDFPEETQNSIGTTLFIDSTNPLPKGTFNHWEYVSSDYGKSFYPIVWQKVGDEKFEAKCHSYDTVQMTDEPSQIVYPKTQCDITDSESFFVGFISESTMSPIQYEMWTENSTEESFGITLIDSGINEISKGWPIVLSEFSEDQMTIARKYSIKGEVCVEDETCRGNLDLDEEMSESTLNKLIIIDQFESSNCISRFESINSEVDVEFYLTLWSSRTDSKFSDKKGSTETLSLQQSIKLRSTKLGRETFVVNLCGFKNAYLALGFVNRELPFKSSRESGNAISMVAANSDPRILSQEGFIGSQKTFQIISSGKMPISYCFSKYQKTGNYNPHTEDTKDMIRFESATNDDGQIFVIFDIKSASKTAKIEDFTTLMAKKSHIVLLSLSKKSQNKFKVEKQWEFMAESTGLNIFELEDDSTIAENSYLGILINKNDIYFKSERSQDTRIYSAPGKKMDLVLVGQEIDVSEFDFEPLFGVRMSYID